MALEHPRRRFGQLLRPISRQRLIEQVEPPVVCQQLLDDPQLTRGLSAHKRCDVDREDLVEPSSGERSIATMLPPSSRSQTSETATP